MLTDEEIQEIRNRAKLNDNRQIDPIAFARDVIAAVLARAGEQEPVGFIKQDLTPFLYYKDSLKLKPDDFLYAHPLPSQAVPEGWQLVTHRTTWNQSKTTSPCYPHPQSHKGAIESK